MDGVGPGSLVAGRYRVQRRLRGDAGNALWQASDETLDRPVSLRVLDSAHPRVNDAVDAARRAAGVEDSRLQRILDVGAEGQHTYLVTEWVTAQTMSELISAGNLPAEEVRRLVGEAASALEAARHRGLHHLALTPDDVLRSHDGPVTLAGLGVEAALAGVEETDPAAASARDAVGLVSLVYAGLTGRWPSGRVDGLEAAPRIAGRLPAPSELTSGVPADLDHLCAQTLAGRRGPLDPGEVAARLAPWPGSPVVSPNRAAGSFPLALGADSAGATTVLPVVGSTDSVQAAVAAARPAAPLPAPPSRPPATFIPPAEPQPDPEAPPQPDPQPDPEPQPEPPPEFQRGFEPTFEPEFEFEPEPQPEPPAQFEPEPEFEPAAPLEPQRQFTALPEQPAEQAPAPLMPPSPIARPPRQQTRGVLGVMAAFVLILCVLAYCGLRSPAQHAKPVASRPSATSSASATTPSPSSSSPASPSATSANPSGAGLTIVGATGFDPQGDGSEDNSLAKRAYDHNKSTGWTSDTYRSASWGGLKKGVGLRLDLGSPQTVTGAQVRVGGSGATVQLRAVKGNSLAGSTVLASQANASGLITLTASAPTTTRYVVIWFTVPGQVGGGYRAEVDEVRLR